MKFTGLIIFAYLFGSVPFGVIIASAHGKDLRKIGSGNTGATNLSRALGRKWAYFCFCLDVLKGLIPVVIAVLLGSTRPSTSELCLTLGVGIAAILGHIFPIYIGFKGGKGAATSFGVALGLWPYYTVCAVVAIIVWAVAVLIWRYISLASILGAIAFPITLILAVRISSELDFVDLWPLLVAAVLIPLMVIVRHRDNIKRIIAGTESKVFTKKSQDATK